MMLTSSGEPHDSTRCRELGIASYLIKPVRQMALCDAILDTLGRTAVETGHSRAGRPDTRARAAGFCWPRTTSSTSASRSGYWKRPGTPVTLAENGLIALDKFEREPFDLILMDMQMPEMGGAEAIAAIREREKATGGAHPDRVAHGARAQGRPRTMPRHGRGRIRVEADLACGAVCGNRAGR